MIVYADTSALVKLFLREPGSEAFADFLRYKELATSSLSFAEAQATFARRLREGWLDDHSFEQVQSQFAAAWNATVEVLLDAEVQAAIPDLCRRHPLRGGDAIQLSSALFLFHEGLNVVFACADSRLLGAARFERLTVYDASNAADLRSAQS